MIVKVKSHKRKSFKELLSYMVHDKDRLFDKNGKSLCINHNVKGNTIESWVKQLQENETFRLRKRKDSVYCTHEILSWHRDDAENISLEKLEEMTVEYMKFRNPRGMYIAIPHFDRQHFHMHICVSGIEYRTGKSMRMSKADFGKLKLNIQKFQQLKYPEFTRSVVDHGKSKKQREKGVVEIKHSEKDKLYLSGLLKTCYKKSNSIETFDSLLKESGLKTYVRGGKLSGVHYKEKKFRLKSLGFSQERIQSLEMISKRHQLVRDIRSKKSKNRDLER